MQSQLARCPGILSESKPVSYSWFPAQVGPQVWNLENEGEVNSTRCTSDDKRPMLILGIDLAGILSGPQDEKQASLQAGEKSTASVAAPRNFRPRAAAEYVPVTEKFGNLVAICPDCGAIMNRRVPAWPGLGQMRGGMDISFPQALEHLVDGAKPTVNSDSR